jgi:hypothetical protein
MHMPTKKARPGKRLHKGIKLEAKQPLKGAKVTADKQPFITTTMSDVTVSSIPPSGGH